MTEATTANYWLSPNALYITLNALGKADYIQANCTNGTQILVFVKGIIDYDNGHNYRRWNLTTGPTLFGDSKEKYVYVAIPRNTEDNQAFVCFPSERIDIYGKNAAGTMLGSEDYYYIFLQGIISANTGSDRVWTQQINTGTLSSDEAISTGGEWYLYDMVSGTVTFLKTILSAVINKLTIGTELIFGTKKVTAIADGSNLNDTSGEHIATPAFVSSFGNKHYLRKDVADTAAEKITFAKGADFGTFVTGPDGSGANINADGDGEFRNIRAWQSLTVSELRFDRASVLLGTNIQTYTGGVVGKVEIINASTGVITLQSSDDEFVGAIQDGALCVGYFHNTEGGNAVADSDNFQGSIQYKGTTCCQFAIDGILNSNSTRFRYELRSGTTQHPVVGMTFKGTGNMKDQSLGFFTIATPKYTAKYAFVTNWIWNPAQHIVEVSGSDISGFASLAGETWTSPKPGTICTSLYTKGAIHQIDNDKRYLYITQSSNGMLLQGETEHVTINVRDTYFREVSDEFTIKFNGQVVTKNSEGKYIVDVSFSSLSADTNEFTITAVDSKFSLSQKIVIKRLILDYHLEVYKTALDAAQDADVDWEYNDGSSLESNSGVAISSTVAGDTVSASRMVGTDLSTYGELCYQIDNLGLMSISNGQNVVVPTSASKISFTWFSDTSRTNILSQRVIPVIVNYNSYMVYHDGDDMPTVPPSGNPFADYGWYEGIKPTSVWMTAKTSANVLDGAWGAAVKIVGTDGKSVSIRGHKANATEIQAMSASEVNDGEGWIADDTGELWVASKTNNILTWTNVGKIQGSNGLTAYIHIKYSPDGVVFSANQGETPDAWMGQCADNNATDPTDFNAYTWKKIEGEVSFTSIVFRRTNTTPSTPVGGTYSSPVPADWHDSVPTGDAIIWMSKCTFWSDNRATSWSTPQQMTDTADFDVDWSTVETNPGNPTDNPSNWSNSATNAIWMATRTCKNGVWSSWQVSKIKGEKGDNGTSITNAIEYYAYGTASAPTASTWGTSAKSPLNESGKQYVWNRTDIVTTDYAGTQTTITGVAHLVNKYIKDGNGVSSFDEYYAVSSGDQPANNSSAWKSSLAEAVALLDQTNRYLWNKEVTHFTDAGDAVHVMLLSVNGQDVTIDESNTKVEYAVSNSGTTTPTSWSTTRPAVSQGQYLWTKTTVTYKIGDSGSKSVVSYTVSYQGVDGKTVTAQYSVDGSTNWHSTFATGDIWMRTSEDGGTTWGGAIRIVGETGASGNYTDFTFAISADLTTSSPTTAPAIFGSWSDAPSATTDAYPYLWMKKVQMTWNATTKKHDAGQAYYSRVTGEQGEQGDTYELRVYKSAANMNSGVDETWQFNDGSSMATNDGVDLATVEAGDTLKATRIKNLAEVTSGYMFYQFNGGDLQSIANNQDVKVTNNVQKVSFWWFEDSAKTKVISHKEIPVVANGVASFTSFVYKRTNTKPATPSGGDYVTPLPSLGGWSDGVPEGEEILWMSQRVFYSDNSQTNGWSEPKQMSDTSDFDVDWSTVATNPGNPTDNPSNWSNSATNAIWMATRTCKNGVWSAWQVFKCKGENGQDGQDGQNGQDGKDGKDGQDGKDGRSYVGTGEFYYASSSNSASSLPPHTVDNHSQWKSKTSELANQFSASYPYLWNFEIVEMKESNGSTTKTPTDPEMISYWGQDGGTGKGVSGVEERYRALASGTPTGDPTSSDATNSADAGFSADKPYLWNNQRVKYDDGTFGSWSGWQQISFWGQNGQDGQDGQDGQNGQDGKDGKDGQDGKDGRSITTVVEMYARNNDKANAPTSGWGTTLLNPDANHLYLWNYEIIKDADGVAISTTNPVIIAIYTKDGKGISSIVEEYALSTSYDTVTEPWSTTVPQMSEDYRYLWNRETIYYTDNTHSTPTPALIGVYGATGPQGPQGEDGAGIEIKGTILKFFETYQDFESEEDKPSGMYLCNSRSFNFRSQLGAFVFNYDADDDSYTTLESERGDAYIQSSDGHLFVSSLESDEYVSVNDLRWQDCGNVKGADAVVYALDIPQSVLPGMHTFNINVVRTKGDSVSRLTYAQCVEDGISVSADRGTIIIPQDTSGRMMYSFPNNLSVKDNTYKLTLKKGATAIQEYRVVCVGSGERGATGPMPRPCGEWQAGTSYVYNDLFRDIVKYGEHYYAVAEYKADGGTSTTWKDTEWTEADEREFVATKLLLAQMAYINNLGVNNLLVEDTANQIQGGFCAKDINDAGGALGLDDIRLWLGGDDPTSAPFRVDYLGNVVANSATLKGDITAKQLTLGLSDHESETSVANGTVITASCTLPTLTSNIGVVQFLVFNPLLTHQAHNITLTCGSNSNIYDSATSDVRYTSVILNNGIYILYGFYYGGKTYWYYKNLF